MNKGVIGFVVAVSLVVTVAIGRPYYLEYQAQKVIAKAQRVIKSYLVDPDSANFKVEKVLSDNSGSIVCGEVNSKNRAGGYNGFHRFIWASYADGDKIAVSGENIQDRFDISYWDIFCKPN